VSAVIDALCAARAFIAPHATPEPAYGFFPGGDFDPRKFTPDAENSAEEIAAHKALCEAWERGERPTVARSGRVDDVSLPGQPDGAGGRTEPIEGPAIVCGSSLGMGVYEYFDREAARVLGLIDEALRAEGVEVPT